MTISIVFQCAKIGGVPHFCYAYKAQNYHAYSMILSFKRVSREDLLQNESNKKFNDSLKLTWLRN